MVLLFIVSGLSNDRVSLLEVAAKARVVRTIDEAHSRVLVLVVLRNMGLSHTRTYAWCTKPWCSLVGHPLCPQRLAKEVTLDEINAIRDMVTTREI